MKEFCLKHPIITFLLAGSLIDGAYKTICFVASCFGKADVTETNETSIETTAEEDADESDNDIQ